MQQDSTEKRRYPRYDSPIPMRYRKIETNAPEFKGGLMKNISVGGARMGIYEFLPRDLRLSMEIPLIPGVKPVAGISRVIWVKKAAFAEQYDVGVEFINLNQADDVQIATFVSNKTAEKVP